METRIIEQKSAQIDPQKHNQLIFDKQMVLEKPNLYIKKKKKTLTKPNLEIHLTLFTIIN